MGRPLTADDRANERLAFDAARLAQEHPPVLRNAHKQAIHAVAMSGEAPRGTIEYSRWPAAALPATVDLATAADRTEVREDHYDYVPLMATGEGLDWHVNFADPSLFVAYGSSLFAQDEVQVAEHPGLASIAEALRARGLPGRTVEADGSPSPVLVAGVERRCHIDTASDAAAGRSAGLYGNALAAAQVEVVRAATHPIVPPTVSNILAMAAPFGGGGRYRRSEIETVLVTATTGFAAAVSETRRLAGTGSPARTVVHTGYWGCGAFGGNRTLMALLQVVAAEMAGLDRLVFHAGTGRGAGGAGGPVGDALELLRGRLATSVGPVAETPALIDAVRGLGLRWGVSDGT